MAGDGASERRTDADLPESVREWLSGVATEQGIATEDLLDRLAGAVGEQSREGMPQNVIARLDALEAGLDDRGDRIDAVAESVDETATAVDKARDDFEEKLRDVRERVIQVKREADGKAPADHDHPDVESDLDALRSDLDALRDELDALDDRIVAGFGNYESILEYLIGATDDLDRKVDRLAGATIDLRRRAGSMTRTEAERSAVADLAAAANRNGTRSAACGACGGSVDLGLLHAPECPHCGTGFTGFDPKEGFFGSHTLRTGDVPALEGDVAGEAPGGRKDDLSGIVDEERRRDPPSEVRELGETTVDTDDSVEETADGPDVPVTESAGNPDERAAEPAGVSLQVIDGIGRAYAGRLREAGVESVEQLHEAEPEALADLVDVSTARVERWIERAGEHVDGG